MLLLVNLDFHNESSTGGVLAINIKYRFAVELSFAKLLATQYVDLFNGAFQLLGENGVQKEQKEFRASLVGKGFFKSEIQSERSELRKFRSAGKASFGNRHKTSFKWNKARGNRIVYNKSGNGYAAYNKEKNVENRMNGNEQQYRSNQ
jgi:hypothetical protein